MTARTPMEQIEAAAQRICVAGYDHHDARVALVVLDTLRRACVMAEEQAKWCADPDLRAALLHPRWGVPAYLADAAGDVASFFNVWDDRRADRAQEAEDNKAADAADARIAL